MPVASITSFDEFKKTINGDKHVVIDFWAPWCGPCKAISPLVDKLSEDNGDVGFYKVNIDDVPDAAEEAGIRVIPTFICYKKGDKVREVTGANREVVKALVSHAVTLQNEVATQ